MIRFFIILAFTVNQVQGQIRAKSQKEVEVQVGIGKGVAVGTGRHVEEAQIGIGGVEAKREKVVNEMAEIKKAVAKIEEVVAGKDIVRVIRGGREVETVEINLGEIGSMAITCWHSTLPLASTVDVSCIKHNP